MKIVKFKKMLFLSLSIFKLNSMEKKNIEKSKFILRQLNTMDIILVPQIEKNIKNCEYNLGQVKKLEELYDKCIIDGYKKDEFLERLEKIEECFNINNQNILDIENRIDSLKIKVEESLENEINQKNIIQMHIQEEISFKKSKIEEKPTTIKLNEKKKKKK